MRLAWLRPFVRGWIFKTSDVQFIHLQTQRTPLMLLLRFTWAPTQNVWSASVIIFVHSTAIILVISLPNFLTNPTNFLFVIISGFWDFKCPGSSENATSFHGPPRLICRPITAAGINFNRELTPAHDWQPIAETIMFHARILHFA